MVSKTAQALKQSASHVRGKPSKDKKRKAEVLNEKHETGESDEQFRQRVATKGGMFLVSFLMT